MTDFNKNTIVFDAVAASKVALPSSPKQKKMFLDMGDGSIKTIDYAGKIETIATGSITNETVVSHIQVSPEEKRITKLESLLSAMEQQLKYVSQAETPADIARKDDIRKAIAGIMGSIPQRIKLKAGSPNVTIEEKPNGEYIISAAYAGGGKRGIGEAPNDGLKYVRQNEQWVEIGEVETFTPLAGTGMVISPSGSDYVFSVDDYISKTEVAADIAEINSRLDSMVISGGGWLPLAGEGISIEQQGSDYTFSVIDYVSGTEVANISGQLQGQINSIVIPDVSNYITYGEVASISGDLQEQIDAIVVPDVSSFITEAEVAAISGSLQSQISSINVIAGSSNVHIIESPVNTFIVSVDASAISGGGSSGELDGGSATSVYLIEQNLDCGGA